MGMGTMPAFDSLGLLVWAELAHWQGGTSVHSHFCAYLDWRDLPISMALFMP